VTAHARREDVSEGLASALRREPWARELGVEYLELVTVATHAGAAVAAVHCVAHRVGSP